MTDIATAFRSVRRLAFAAVVLGVLVLTGCSSKKSGGVVVPTLANLSEMATHDAQSVAVVPSSTTFAPVSTTAVPEEPAVTAPPTAQPTVPPTVSPAATQTAPPPTATLTVTPTPSVTPTVLSPEQRTATAEAGVLPFTQTAVAIIAATQTARARITPTPTASLTPTPLPGPVEPFQVVYYTNRNGSDDIYLMTLNGVERPLVTSAANEREPSCSPDGKSVVFASDATGSYQLYLLPFDRTEPIPLSPSDGMNFAPVFSPDGASIAFVSTRSGGIPTIWIMDADGGNPRQITTDLGRDTSPAWGPDGRQLLYSSEQFGPWDLFLTVLGDNVEGEFPVMPPEFSQGNELWPFFDAVGERIAYTEWANLEDPQTADIYMLDFELPEPQPVRVQSGADIAWSWGDDTHLLASVGGPDDVQIALVDVTNGAAVRLTHDGSFNGGARLCTVPPEALPPVPTLAPTPTPTLTPSITPTATPSLTPTVSPFTAELLNAAGHPHIVQPGDTLMSIGYHYGVNWMALAQINALRNPDLLAVGQRLTIPVTRVGRHFSGYQLPDDDDQTARMGVRKEIVVELDTQTAEAIEDGRVIRTVSVSTGLPGSPTVLGEYSIYYKTEAQTMSGPGYFLPDVPYVMYFYQGYGLHGTYWHNNFGHPMSHGCVNLPTDEARWFYQWAEIGTPVLVRN